MTATFRHIPSEISSTDKGSSHAQLQAARKSSSLLLFLFAVVCCLAVMTLPALADSIGYINGGVNGELHGWPMSPTSTISDSFELHGLYTPNLRITGITIWVWTNRGERPDTVSWSVTSRPNGGTVYASGRATGLFSGGYFVRTNHLGYDVYFTTLTTPHLVLGPGVYWVNLSNGTTTGGNILYWDENDGLNCQWRGCPSQAYQNTFTPIGSETFLVWYLCPHCVP
jgi:hypothetical protein